MDNRIRCQYSNCKVKEKYTCMYVLYRRGSIRNIRMYIFAFLQCHISEPFVPRNCGNVVENRLYTFF